MKGTCEICFSDCASFTLDPEGKECDGCWRGGRDGVYPEKVSPPDLNIHVHEDVKADPHFGR